MLGKKYPKLNDVEAYKLAFHLSNYVWKIAGRWDNFTRDTLGKQFVRSVDSISANLAEGFGRYHKKEKIHFYRYALGSVTESLDWNEKARIRQLLTPEEYTHIFSQLQMLPKSIHIQIKYTHATLTT
ncbi:MAG: four helix bundle protein [Cytophagales bacterium]|nr:four helix bundle protein [Cytophagales bacterium]